MNLRYLSIVVCLTVVSLASTTFAVQQYRSVPRVADSTGGFRVQPLSQPQSLQRQQSQQRQQPQQRQQSQHQLSERVTHPGVRDELYRRIELDQMARKRIIESARNAIDGKPDPTLVQDRVRSDRSNRQWLADLLRDNNNRWPGKTMVGEAGAHAAWMIVQHSDEDPAFQARCLSFMRSSPEGEVAVVDIAFLTDEVLVARNEKQRYGTQIQMRNGRFRVAPVEDEQNLDARRATLGLESIEVYLDSIRTNYQARTVSNVRSR